MTRQELLDKLIKTKRKSISYTTAQVISAIAGASQAEKDSLTAAVNANDKALVGAIIDTLFDAKRNKDASDEVNTLITGDKIDIDDIASLLNGA